MRISACRKEDDVWYIDNDDPHDFRYTMLVYADSSDFLTAQSVVYDESCGALFRIPSADKS